MIVKKVYVASWLMRYKWSRAPRASPDQTTEPFRMTELVVLCLPALALPTDPSPSATTGRSSMPIAPSPRYQYGDCSFGKLALHRGGCRCWNGMPHPGIVPGAAMLLLLEDVVDWSLNATHAPRLSKRFCFCYVRRVAISSEERASRPQL